MTETLTTAEKILLESVGLQFKKAIAQKSVPDTSVNKGLSDFDYHQAVVKLNKEKTPSSTSIEKKKKKKNKKKVGVINQVIRRSSRIVTPSQRCLMNIQQEFSSKLKSPKSKVLKWKERQPFSMFL